MTEAKLASYFPTGPEQQQQQTTAPEECKQRVSDKNGLFLECAR